MENYAFVVHFVWINCTPKTILTKKGTDFLNKTFAETCKLIKINKIYSSPFHSQTNRSLEIVILLNVADNNSNSGTYTFYSVFL